ncbi:hypothetical protein HOY80DRAFT_1134625 [Tuber brumale]|nr:hypothetical protein HOY80DRAFT_1134625 [Tuber brumale]
MSYQQHGAGEYWQGAPEGANLNPLAGYNTTPEALYTFQPGPGYGQEDPDQSGGLGASNGEIWGMKRKTFLVALGIFIILIIALAAGVGAGVAATVAKSNSNASEPPKSSSSADPSQSSTSSSEISGSEISGSEISGSETSSNVRFSSVRSSSVRSSSARSSSERSSSASVRLITSTISISVSPTPTPILKNTPLAAVNWDNGSIQLDDSGIAAISWFEEVPPQGQQIRVYSLDEGNSLVETIWNSSVPGVWYTHVLSSTLDPAAAGSQLTAYYWFAGGVQNIRVYYQGQDGYIREAVYTTGPGARWRRGDAPKIEDFPQARSGSGLAVLLFSDRNQAEDARLYYQNMDGRLVSYDYKREASFVQSWQKSTIDHGIIPDRTHITAVVNKSGNQTLRIYFTQDAMLKEIWWDQIGGWRQSWSMEVAAAPGVAAISYSDDVRVFFQRNTETISSESLNRQRNRWELSWVGQGP